MRVNLMFSVLCLIMAACNSTVNKEADAQKEGHSHHVEESGKLTLNNGVRWKTDESTKRNVVAIRDLVFALEEENMQSIESFHAAADEIKTKTNVLIKECKMQGPDHDALHLWLYPLLDDIKALSIASEPETAKQLFDSILHRLYAFDTYFD